MQGAGEGRELSITFQTSGKAVRLGAPEKWRKAVAGEDLKPDTWVEIVRQGGSPQTVRARDVPELRALFVELGQVSAAPPPEPAADDPPPTPDPAGGDDLAAPPPPAQASTRPAGASADRVAPPSPLGRGRRRRGAGEVIGVVVVVMVIAGLMRTCGRGEHHRDLSALDSGQMSIAVDPSAPFPSSAPAPAPVDTAPPTEAAALQTAAPDTAAGPGFDCAGAASETLKLICATPELAAADRTLAAAYQHALAASADPDALRDSERAWLVARDGAPADVDQLRGLYAERIRALGGAPSSSGADPF